MQLDGRRANLNDAAGNVRPAGFCTGPGHMVVHGNESFRQVFGATSLGMPIREAAVELPPEAFALLDAVLGQGRPLARWIEVAGEEWRLTAAPRVDPETREVYGVAFHLRARSDLPVLGDAVDSR